MQLAALVAFVPQLQFFRNDSLFLIQTVAPVDESGTPQPSHNAIPFSGAVDPSQSETLNRMLEGQNLSGAIMVVTSQPLSAGSENRASDTIQWCGRLYSVQRVADFSEGGIGIRQAACTLIGVNPAL
ncbi:hypothetical protein ABC766_00330 [Methylobacterium fujisawaense]|jgi:hypothetical protein|uniref:hypothetical protein n=1 Tax=Methylobacterium fujisawaense TaxID=107400 RepID=UPI0031F5A0C7